MYIPLTYSSTYLFNYLLTYLLSTHPPTYYLSTYKPTYLSTYTFVTKNRGSETYSTWTVFNEPRRPRSINLLHIYRPPISLTLELPTNSFVCTLQIKDVQTQQHGRPHNSQLLPHSFTQMPAKGTLLLHYRRCTILRKHKHCFPSSVHKTSDPLLFSLSLSFLCSNN
jgi:hypothetical protein